MYENLKGKIISFEGGEGAGKSSLIKSVMAVLVENGIDVYMTREPGGNEISEQIRKVIVDKNNTSICGQTEALLYAASRAQLFNENIRPLLKENKTIIFDRFIDSSYVYQGYVRGLGIENIKKINDVALNGFLPDVTILLDIDPKIGLKRIYENNRETNRLDLESLDFHEKVRKGYLLLCTENQDRIKIVDASKDRETVLKETLKILKNV